MHIPRMGVRPVPSHGIRDRSKSNAGFIPTVFRAAPSTPQSLKTTGIYTCAHDENMSCARGGVVQSVIELAPNVTTFRHIGRLAARLACDRSKWDLISRGSERYDIIACCYCLYLTEQCHYVLLWPSLSWSQSNSSLTSMVSSRSGSPYLVGARATRSLSYANNFGMGTSSEESLAVPFSTSHDQGSPSTSDLSSGSSVP